MALTTPVLYGVAAFDASNAQTFRFNVIGGDQVTGATLTIRDNTTLSIIKTVTQTSFEFAITLPAGSLTNGGYYQATITTRNAQGVASVPSAPIQFYCYSTPIFVFTNIREGGVVGNSNYSFSVQYNQIQNEGLASYNFKLYSASGTLLQESGAIYNTISTLPLTLSYTFSGFENNAAYSIEVTGTTNEGTEISTGRVGFLVQYVEPEVFSLIALSNNCQGGYITIKSNLTDIEGESNPEAPTYIDNKEIDLRADGYYVKWDKNYTIPTNWTTRLWGRNFTSGKNILEMTNESEDLLSIKYVLDNSTAKTREKIGDGHFELRALNAGDTWAYTVESNEFPVHEESDNLFCWIRKNNNLYDIKGENLSIEEAGTA